VRSSVSDRDEVVAILKRVRDPEAEKSLFELALVHSIDLREDGTLVINIDFKRRTTFCPACVPIAWLVQKGITDALAEEFLRYPAVRRVEFIDQ